MILLHGLVKQWQFFKSVPSTKAWTMLSSGRLCQYAPREAFMVTRRGSLKLSLALAGGFRKGNSGGLR
jgi:hypothetical protein